MKIICVAGTRPEAIKMAPVILALQKNTTFNVRVLATAQHRQMLDQVFAVFGIVPDIDLDIMQPNQSLPTLTARLLLKLDEVLQAEQPDVVLAQGDTTTVMTVALACFYLRIPFGHIEAGLRTWDIENPFPEEMNRRLIGRLATWHFAPTSAARGHLIAEGTSDDVVEVTGNTGIDNLKWVVERGLGNSSFPSSGDARWRVLVTLHRRENHGAVTARLSEEIRILANRHELSIVLPLHPNPSVRKVVVDALGDEPRVRLVAPLSYVDFIATLADSDFVMTDSGGVQEEAPALGKPVLILRNTTERPEAVDLGVSLLVGVDPATVSAAVDRLCHDSVHFHRMSQPVFPYGDGAAADRITERLLRDLRVEEALDPVDADVVDVREGTPRSVMNLALKLPTT